MRGRKRAQKESDGVKRGSARFGCLAYVPSHFMVRVVFLSWRECGNCSEDAARRKPAIRDRNLRGLVAPPRSSHLVALPPRWPLPLGVGRTPVRTVRLEQSSGLPVRRRTRAPCAHSMPHRHPPLAHRLPRSHQPMRDCPPAAHRDRPYAYRQTDTPPLHPSPRQCSRRQCRLCRRVRRTPPTAMRAA